VQYRSNLRDFKLRYGDAMLLYGSREKFKYIGEEQDFIVLTAAAYDAPQTSKLITAVAIMGLVLIPVIAGWLPIAISALMGVVLMILFGCLTMEEAYRSIDWRAVFLIAGLIPLGIALESSGAAQMLAESVVSIVGGYGPLAIMGGLFIMAAVLAQIIPNPAVALLVAPIAYNTAVNTGISPYPLMMAVAVAASAAFLSPVGHPANLLVMGPGGYKISDFIKAGIPVLLVVFAVAMIVVPLVWSF
jgi:di/tricarboxylate transporter